ncbi:MAG: hypothetical protein K1X53_03860, partial [Candidatus Sumerlaeaceae bacterium]|nr:hypothetical protein [Candidatus Sumerlaeaceae bacterium]
MDERDGATTETIDATPMEPAGGFIARFRRALGGLPESPPSARFSISCWLFLRGLGLTYLAALLSLWVQIDGLVGSRGILPAAELYATVKERFGGGGFLLVPGIAWFSASDSMLHGICAAGVVAAVLLILDVLPALAAGVLWI